MRVLLVEDDDRVAAALVEGLTAYCHEPTRVRYGANALIAHHDCDVVLLDLGLPDMDGQEVLRKLRSVSDVPIVVLTARADERSVVRGLHQGADDYVVKPVGLAELVARLEGVTARPRRRIQESLVVVDDVEIDLRGRQVRVAGAEIVLTATEFAVLAVLARHVGTAVSWQRIKDEVWGDAFLAVSRALSVHLSQLRSKLDRPGLIETIRGYGLRLGR